LKEFNQNIWWHICSFPIRTKPSKKQQKSHQANAQRQTQMTTNKNDRKEGRSANIGFAKWRVSCFYDSLVRGSSLVFQMNICAENPPLRKAENR
jgi:hypothetical protein